MAVFGKRPASPDANTPHAQQPVSSGKPVIVKQSAVEAAKTGSDFYLLVQGIVEFVNFALHQASYVRTELEQKALQVYHADYYLAQVNNGGHSQFIHNASRNRDLTNADALAGLSAMQAQHVETLTKMMAWIAAHPDEGLRCVHLIWMSSIAHSMRTKKMIRWRRGLHNGFSHGQNCKWFRMRTTHITSHVLQMQIPKAQTARCFDKLHS
jgi:hypothetical protein